MATNVSMNKQPEEVPEDITDERIFCIRDFFKQQTPHTNMEDAQGFKSLYINTLQKYMSLHCNKTDFYEYFKPVFYRQEFSQRRAEDDILKENLKVVAMETGSIGSLNWLGKKICGLFFVIAGQEHDNLKLKLSEMSLVVSDVEKDSLQQFLQTYWMDPKEMMFDDTGLCV